MVSDARPDDRPSVDESISQAPHRPFGGALLLVLLLVWTVGCSGLRQQPTSASSTASLEESSATENRTGPTVVLISLDGFRWDYLDRSAATNLRRLATEGVRAERLIPSFPTKTFPNHYSIATGLRPGHHGIVANNMYDPEFDAEFALRIREAVEDGRWWEGEPIWVTAERQGLTSAAFFWPGTEAEIAGVRPTFWRHYEHTTPHTERVEQAVEWLRLPAVERPSLITLYFSDVDDAGHDHGPAPSDSLNRAIAHVDASIGRLIEEIEQLEDAESIQLVIVSDHGMTETSADRVIALDDYIDIQSVRVVDWSPVLAIRPDPSEVDRVYESLSEAHPNLRVYRREEIPAAWAYRDHRRIAPIIGVADEGWTVTWRERIETCATCFDGGTHGYAPEVEAMGGIFIAWGSEFRSGMRIPPFDNIHIYELLCRVLELEPAPNDGSVDVLAGTLQAAE